MPTAEPLDFSPGPPAVLAMRQVLGQPLSSAHPRAAHEAGVLLERLHRVGALPPFTTGEATWDGHIFAWLECELASLSRLEALAASEIGRLGARFGRLRAILSSRPIALLHGDLQPDHVLVEERGEGVVAFLDFADAQPGDPLLDIAVLTRWEETLVPRILSGYAGLDDDAETWTLLAEYRLLRKLSEIPWLLERGYTEYANRNLIAIRDFLS